jgi:hypothetical protein
LHQNPSPVALFFKPLSALGGFEALGGVDDAAWSKGGATDIANCQMLCKTHNRAKGNK